MQLNRLLNESMAELKGGLASTTPCSYDPRSCKYINSDYACPFNYSCQIVSEYGVPIGDPVADDNNANAS